MTLTTLHDHYSIYHIDVSKHKPELYENSSFPNLVVNARFAAAPAEDYVMWVIVLNEREATLNLDNKQMKLIR